MQIIKLSEDQWNRYPEGFLEQMGKLVVEFGRAEYLVKLVFKQLHGLPFSEGLALAEGHRQFSTLCEETKKTADEKLADVAQRNKLVDVLDEMRELSVERNHMIHAMWYAIDDESMQRSRVELDKKAGKLDWSKSAQFTAAHMKNLAWRLQVCREYLHALRQTWPQMSADTP